MFEYFGYSQFYDVPDPAQVRSRIELCNPWRRVGIIVHARRDRVVPIFEKWPQQSDYAAGNWAADEGAGVPLPPAEDGLPRKVINRVKRTFPWLVYLRHGLVRRYPALRQRTGRYRNARANRKFAFESQPEKFKPVKF